MRSAERKIIENIILINPLIYGLQDSIEKEQERVIADMTSPADKVIKKLYALDDRRIDLCNLKVLYGFIEDGLGDKFDLLRSCAACCAACDYYELAARQLARAGYTLQKAEKEFSYLFKLIKRPRAARRYLPAHSAADATIGAT